MKRISIVNQKGGVAKTTTTINLGAALAKLGHRVLLCDLDPQRNLSDTLGYVHQNQPITMNELIYFSAYGMSCDFEQFIQHNETEGLDFIPAARSLDAAPTVLATAKDGNTVLNRSVQSPCFSEYDYILYDCRPSLDLLTANALAASTGVIIPVEPEEYAMTGLADVLDTIESTRQQFNPALELTGVLMTKADRRRRAPELVKAELEEVLGGVVFQTIIPLLVEAADAAKERRSCVSRPSSEIGALYMALAKEVQAR